MDNSTSESSMGYSGAKVMVGLLWLASVALAIFIGFSYGRGSITDNSQSQQTTLVKNVTPIPTAQANVEAVTSAVTPTEANTPFCQKTGFAQKWEYLTPYTVKQGDTLEDIATSHLGDSGRVNEILQLNGVGPLVVGATLYLPPTTVPKSSGNLREVYGKLVEKNSVSWHINFSSDENSQGILIPSFWFDTIATKDSFKVGDCVKVFFEDGYRVFSVSLQ